MKKLAISAAATAAAFALTAPAQAATLVIDQTPEPCTVADPVCTFSFDQQTPAGMFDDMGTFELPQLGSVGGVLTSFAIGAASGNIDFSEVYFLDPNSVRYDFTITNGQVDLAENLGIAAIAGTWTIRAIGTADSNASYAGDLTFSAVPEPGTWALMILGFGAIGFSMRGRKEKARRISVKYA